ncbi:MAG: hypothetical protein EZS28_033941 [Streblomastix strix]|uniref:SPRY domain-containing protein n=1 Tax=Streblomastix strix TaxID=222440 RepID=A0A5J4UKK5_9EUKA|nr:MAG: hypothetical protein EZS28_033941 [Streblomastix strix]
MSKSGKQSLIDGISTKPEIHSSLVEFGFIEHAAEMMDKTFSSPTSELSISSSSSQYPLQFQHEFTMNILEVIDKLLKSDVSTENKTGKLKSVAEKVLQNKLPKPVKLAIQQILLILEQEDDDDDDQHISTELQLPETQERIRTAEEHVREADERARIAENQRISGEYLRRQAQEQLLLKDAEIQFLKDEITRLQFQAVSQYQTPLYPQISIIPDDVGQNVTIELLSINSNEKAVKIERINGTNMKATSLQNEHVCILLNKDITEGIYIVNLRFEKSNNQLGCANGYVGIVKSEYKIPYPCNPIVSQNLQNMLSYYGAGQVWYKEKWMQGNAKFSDGQMIRLEINADVGTLNYYVDGYQQPVFVTGISEAVKIWKDSSITIVSVKKLTYPIAQTIPNQKSVQW